MSVYYRWKTFDEDEDRPEKPRRYGVTEMRGPQYTLLSHNMLQVYYLSFIMLLISYNRVIKLMKRCVFFEHLKFYSNLNVLLE